MVIKYDGWVVRSTWKLKHIGEGYNHRQFSWKRTCTAIVLLAIDRHKARFGVREGYLHNADTWLANEAKRIYRQFELWDDISVAAVPGAYHSDCIRML